MRRRVVFLAVASGAVLCAQHVLIERRLEGAYGAYWISPRVFQRYQIEDGSITVWRESSEGDSAVLKLWSDIVRVDWSKFNQDYVPAKEPKEPGPELIHEQDEVTVHLVIEPRRGSDSIYCVHRRACPAEINQLVDQLERLSVEGAADVRRPSWAVRAFDAKWDRGLRVHSELPSLSEAVARKSPAVLRAIVASGRLIPLDRAGEQILAGQEYLVTLSGGRFRIERWRAGGSH